MENTPPTANLTPPQTIFADPETIIDQAQIVGEVMAVIQATNEEEIGRQGIEKATQGEAAPRVSIFTIESLNYYYYFLFLI